MSSYNDNNELWCKSGSKEYVYDGKITWSEFRNVIKRLNLTSSFIQIYFDYNIEIEPAWKCPFYKAPNITFLIGYSSEDMSPYSMKKYILFDGCLHDVSYRFDRFTLPSRPKVSLKIHKKPISKISKNRKSKTMLTLTLRSRRFRN